ncbi:MAG: helix-turn-helix transcriptional regulator [Oscillospiraceae bacterium]|nr:helix-turn-helix transcriptional regulator [Oscillospiraceae bacterium]
MTHAYQEIYLSKAQAVLGDAFDYAVNTCNMSGSDFTKLFTASSVSKRMENGEPAYLAGKSGIEIVLEVIFETMGKQVQVEPQDHMGRSREYWIGWAAAYYQWHSGRKYSDIFKVISFEDMQKLYYPLHEADITKFVETADKLMKEYFADTNLKRIRTAYGCTQAELAKRSGVSLRSIQMYEQRNKDINKASVETVYSLAKVLGCTIEDLIERQGAL